jgi:hypothetical protein
MSMRRLDGFLCVLFRRPHKIPKREIVSLAEGIVEIQSPQNPSSLGRKSLWQLKKIPIAKTAGVSLCGAFHAFITVGTQPEHPPESKRRSDCRFTGGQPKGNSADRKPSAKPIECPYFPIGLWVYK